MFSFEKFLPKKGNTLTPRKDLGVRRSEVTAPQVQNPHGEIKARLQAANAFPLKRAQVLPEQGLAPNLDTNETRPNTFAVSKSLADALFGPVSLSTPSDSTYNNHQPQPAESNEMPHINENPMENREEKEALAEPNPAPVVQPRVLRDAGGAQRRYFLNEQQRENLFAFIQRGVVLDQEAAAQIVNPNPRVEAIERHLHVPPQLNAVRLDAADLTDDGYESISGAESEEEKDDIPFANQPLNAPAEEVETLGQKIFYAIGGRVLAFVAWLEVHAEEDRRLEEEAEVAVARLIAPNVNLLATVGASLKDGLTGTGKIVATPFVWVAAGFSAVRARMPSFGRIVKLGLSVASAVAFVQWFNNKPVSFEAQFNTATNSSNCAPEDVPFTDQMAQTTSSAVESIAAAAIPTIFTATMWTALALQVVWAMAANAVQGVISAIIDPIIDPKTTTNPTAPEAPTFVNDNCTFDQDASWTKTWNAAAYESFLNRHKVCRPTCDVPVAANTDAMDYAIYGSLFAGPAPIPAPADPMCAPKSPVPATPSFDEFLADIIPQPEPTPVYECTMADAPKADPNSAESQLNNALRMRGRM